MAAIVLDILVLMVILGIIGILITYLYFRIRDDQLFCPERKVIVQARKSGLPVLAENELGGSNRTRLFLGKKVKNDQFIFDLPSGKVHLDVSKITTDCAPQNLGYGLNVFQYSTMHAEPISVANATALQTLIKTVSDKFPILNSLPDDQKIDLLNSPDSDIDEDSKNLIQTFKLDDATALAPEVREAKSELARTPVDLGFFCYSYAFRLISTASTGYHMMLYGDVREQIAKQEVGKSNWDQWMPLIVIVGIILASALAYTIISH